VRKLLAILPLAVVAMGCGSRNTSTPPSAPTSPVKSVLADPVNDLPLLWNGLIGVRIGPNGTPETAEGVNAPLYAIDEYLPTGEEKILPVPNTLSAKVGLNRAAIALPAESARMDFSTGILTLGGKTEKGNFECRTVLNPTERILAQRWKITPSQDTMLTFGGNAEPPLGADKSEREYAMTLANGRIRAAVRLRRSGGTWEPTTNTIKLAKGATFTGEVTWSLSRSANWPALLAARGIEVDLVANWDKPLPPPTYDQVATAARKTWAKRWETDIEIDGPKEDQEAVRSFLFYLRSAISPNGDMVVSPFALSKGAYGGHIFWDADVWVFPALALIDPQTAKAIPNYRLAREPAAQANYHAWLNAKRPIAKSRFLGVAPPADALTYPWESSVTGKETVVGGWTVVDPGPSKQEVHITGSVVWSLERAAALGLADPAHVKRIGRRAAEYYLHRGRFRPDGKFEIPGVMSPDEHHVGDNDLYTNLLAKHVIDTYAADRYPNGIDIVLPRDSKSFLTYDNDAERGYKQVAALLAVYPLQYPPAELQARTMLERFAPKVIKNGPAMSDAIDAVVWARLGEPELAYDEWRRSWREFTEPPLMLFREKRDNGNTYFTTGAAGCLQTVLFGFLGFRLDSQKDPAASWSKKLIGEHWLTIKPNLPKAWRSVKFKNFTVLGHRYTLTATHSGVTVTQGD
jgi:hypothetical protein